MLDVSDMALGSSDASNLASIAQFTFFKAYGMQSAFQPIIEGHFVKLQSIAITPLRCMIGIIKYFFQSYTYC